MKTGPVTPWRLSSISGLIVLAHVWILGCASAPAATSTPQPTPTASPREIIERSANRMIALDTAEFSLTHEGASSTVLIPTPLVVFNLVEGSGGHAGQVQYQSRRIGGVFRGFEGFHRDQGCVLGGPDFHDRLHQPEKVESGGAGTFFHSTSRTWGEHWAISSIHWRTPGSPARRKWTVWSRGGSRVMYPRKACPHSYPRPNPGSRSGSTCGLAGNTTCCERHG